MNSPDGKIPPGGFFFYAMCGNGNEKSEKNQEKVVDRENIRCYINCTINHSAVNMMLAGS